MPQTRSNLVNQTKPKCQIHIRQRCWIGFWALHRRHHGQPIWFRTVCRSAVCKDNVFENCQVWQQRRKQKQKQYILYRISSGNDGWLFHKTKCPMMLTRAFCIAYLYASKHSKNLRLSLQTTQTQGRNRGCTTDTGTPCPMS